MKWALLAGDEDRKWTELLNGRLGDLSGRKLKVVGLEAWAAGGNGIAIPLESAAIAAYWDWPFQEKFGERIALVFPTEMGQVESEEQRLQWLVTAEGLKLSWTGEAGFLGKLLGLGGTTGEKELVRTQLPGDFFWFTPRWEQRPGSTRAERPSSRTLTEFWQEQPGPPSTDSPGPLAAQTGAASGDDGGNAGAVGDLDDLTLESMEIPRPSPVVMPAPVSPKSIQTPEPPPRTPPGEELGSFGIGGEEVPPPALPTQISCVHPQLCQADDPFLLEVVLHLPEAPPSPIRPGDKVERALGNTQLPAGAGLRVEVRPPPGFSVDSPQNTLTWLPPSSRVGFMLTAEKGIQDGSYIIPVLLYPTDGSVAFCRVYATVAVGSESAEKAGDRPTATIPQRIFASYASKDRAEVLERVASLEALGMDVFVDCLDISEGQRWEEGIQRQICTRDALLLFWSRAAAASRWVEQEWKLALEERGLDYIFPNALETPSLCPPPPPLAALQFGSALLATPWSARPSPVAVPPPPAADPLPTTTVDTSSAPVKKQRKWWLLVVGVVVAVLLCTGGLGLLAAAAGLWAWGGA